MTVVKESKIKEAVEKAAETEKVQVLNVEISPRPGATVVRLIVDQPGGINIQECARFNRAVNRSLEEQGFDLFEVSVEVASPGLDRKLKTEADFKWATGRLGKLVLREPVGGNNVIRGRIVMADSTGLEIESAEDRALRIDYKNIVKANLEIG